MEISNQLLNFKNIVHHSPKTDICHVIFSSSDMEENEFTDPSTESSSSDKTSSSLKNYGSKKEDNEEEESYADEEQNEDDEGL